LVRWLHVQAKDKVKESIIQTKEMVIMVELQVGLMMELILLMRLKYPTNDFLDCDMAGNVADRFTRCFTNLSLIMKLMIPQLF
jgi:hypothetical protein